jgi:outer membrane protein assembly factor BamB
MTGETLWKKEREKAAIWASPVVFRPAAELAAQVIMQSTRGLASLDPKTGKENWRVEQPCKEIPSTTIAGGLLVAPFKVLTVLRPPGATQAPEALWSDSKLAPDTPTPIAYKDRLYVVKGSVLSCAELETGKSDWRLRLKSGKASSSPVAANGRLFVADEDGVLQAIRLGGDKGEVEGRVELGEKIMGTPAISGGGLYLRSDRHLWKFGIAE